MKRKEIGEKEVKKKKKRCQKDEKRRNEEKKKRETNPSCCCSRRRPAHRRQGSSARVRRHQSSLKPATQSALPLPSSPASDPICISPPRTSHLTTPRHRHPHQAAVPFLKEETEMNQGEEKMGKIKERTSMGTGRRRNAGKRRKK
jgi:hypothetical protein